MNSVGLPSAAKDDELDDGHSVIAWRCGSCKCCTQDITCRECDFCLTILPDRYCVFGGPIDHLVPAFGRLSVSWAASPIEIEVQQLKLPAAINAPSQILHNPVPNSDIVIAWECDFCKCTTKDLNHRDCPFCLRQVATRYGISRGPFDPSIGRVSIVRTESPMDDPDVTAQLWQDIMHHSK
jgi:hypothetical protein